MTEKYKVQIMLNNPDGLARNHEPVITKLHFDEVQVHKDSLVLYNEADEKVDFQLIDVKLEDDYIREASIVYLVQMEKGQLVRSYWLLASDQPAAETVAAPEGIVRLEPTQSDGVRRLDTGEYILELCTGTADGTSYGKWGIRYFESKKEGRNLIKDYSNAIGGFYGPFFTPKNGLINPPEHTKVDFTVEEEGPLYCRYRFEGIVPDGLDPNLKGKGFTITWEFFYHTPWFRRTYEVDDFSTTVDGIPVVNKITVGDEYESGQGDTVFNTFACYGGTYYREGDLYANILYDGVYKLLDEADESNYPNIKKYRDSIGQELNEVSWDYFWRLFCIKEGILSAEEIEEHVDHIIPEAHRQVHQSDRNNDVLYSAEGVDVNATPQQTIFPMSANKTAEINKETGYAMVWYTSEVVSRYQIVQRKDSGWVNWGTNGENEYPELPTGSTIYTAYGQFEDWEQQADTMEKNIDSKQGMVEVLAE
ncbi:hypothetical protein [Gracilibacillus alcaliphilus]|uniref:hypothetical protein n=1 Tax=Gracilibacillus alcaliphilus TaxID=1401441 RepID=UPI00195D1EEB|nr:hypothetical protein [Gracilibacillus alcaliphilus]MBM7679623.1 hypothetical protein [Gracilibacillus alcaliphilus]